MLISDDTQAIIAALASLQKAVKANGPLPPKSIVEIGSNQQIFMSFYANTPAAFNDKKIAVANPRRSVLIFQSDNGNNVTKLYSTSASPIIPASDGAGAYWISGDVSDRITMDFIKFGALVQGEWWAQNKTVGFRINVIEVVNRNDTFM